MGSVNGMLAVLHRLGVVKMCIYGSGKRTIYVLPVNKNNKQSGISNKRRNSLFQQSSKVDKSSE